ncbi:MAG: insulinase family protein [Chitinophagales bacterium]|nr:insulinase family protein [Chitinophagales bacterium]
MNRTEAPELKDIHRLDINNFKTITLNNGVPLYIVDGVEEDLVRIEIRFPAGRWHENKHGQSHATPAQMKKGTAAKTSLEIAEAIEYYGAQLDTSSGQDHTAVTLYSLGKYIKEIIPVVEEILQEAIFPEQELELYKERKTQRMRINAQNTDYHANRKYNEVIFGDKHPYGYAIKEKDVDNLQKQDLLDYYRSYFNIAEAKIFISGNIKEDVIRTVEKHFGHQQKMNNPDSATDKSLHTLTENKFYIPHKDSVQSSVRIGGISIPKDHPDFPELNVLNTVFGGYFGSRLMSNIREDKGYTYGIHSSIGHNLHGSYFSIDTEVSNEVCKNVVHEIYYEMELLRSNIIPDDELSIVKNYMLGTFLRATDGPFNRINVVRNIVLSGLDISYFNRLVEAAKTVTPARLQELANQYFVKSGMKEIVCGNIP